MAKKAAGLTARGIETIRQPGLYADGHGLYLQVSATGAKSWIFRYVSPTGEAKGKRRDMGLGPIRLLGLADARRRALDLGAQLRDGVDPLGERRVQETAQAVQAAKAVSFLACTEAYIAAMKPGWRNSKHGAMGLHPGNLCLSHPRHAAGGSGGHRAGP